MGLRENLQTEPVSELPLRPVVTIAADRTLQQAVESMQAEHIGCAVIVDDQQKPIGTFTENELVHLLDDCGTGVLNEPVANHMSPAWAHVTETEPIARLLDAMQSGNVRFVVVCDEEGRAKALTGQKGMMEYISEHFSRVVAVQRVDTPEYPESREGA